MDYYISSLYDDSKVKFKIMTEIGYFLTIDALITWGVASLVYKFSLGKIESKPSLLFRLIFVSCSTFLLSLFFGSYSSIFLLDSQNMTEYLVACIISGLSVTIGDLFYYMSLKRIDSSRAYPLVQLSLLFVYPFSFIFLAPATPSLPIPVRITPMVFAPNKSATQLIVTSTDGLT